MPGVPDLPCEPDVDVRRGPHVDEAGVPFGRGRGLRMPLVRGVTSGPMVLVEYDGADRKHGPDRKAHAGFLVRALPEQDAGEAYRDTIRSDSKISAESRELIEPDQPVRLDRTRSHFESVITARDHSN